MFDAADVARIREMVFAQVAFTSDMPIEVKAGEGLSVQGDRHGAVIACDSKPALARGFFRLAQELSSGHEQVNVQEKPRFASCGCFLDMSRNAVMTVEAVKLYMDACAALGMNLVVLYTEDTYTVPEYPHFGYLRGRYTPEELRALDAYACSLGIELMPCIQTLAHLENFLQWKPQIHLNDQPGCLLIDEDETYAVIEACIRSLRGCISGKRLHIGMDEAHGVGLGHYYEKHGLTDRFALLNRHLARVTDICQRYGFEPIMWSDMFFRLGSKKNDYYDRDAVIPQQVIDALPPVDLCYWDYYHKDEAFYDHMLSEHERMGRTVFAGGIWTWSGFLPHVERTNATMIPALRACARHGVQTVMATMWGDDGNETSHFLAMNQLALFSEFCWRGEACPMETIEATGAYLTGLSVEAYRAFGLFYPSEQDVRTGKALVYCDPLYPIGPSAEAMAQVEARYAHAREVLAGIDRPDCRYADALFDLCLQKIALLRTLRPLYQAGDRAAIARLAQESIPALQSAYARLRDLHRAQWESAYKRNGWEVMALRYGAVMGRLADVQDALLRWSRGELDTLCELDEVPLDASRKYGMQFFSVYATPMYNL